MQFLSAQPIPKTRICVLAMLFLLGMVNLHAQKVRKKNLSAETIIIEDSIVRYSQSDIFDFPNVGKIDFYFNKKKFHTMLGLVNSKQDYKAYEAMREYVRNYGITNFRKAPGLIWDLARYARNYGPPGEAIQLYKLAIKHYADGTDTTALFREFDAINPDKTRYYVPIERYRQLVAARKDIDTLIAPRPAKMNMGAYVNSRKEDYAPSLGFTDNLILFSSKRNSNNAIPPRFDEDIFYSSFQNGIWTKAREFDINTSFNEGSVCITPDGKTIIFSRCHTPSGLGNCDLHQATLQPDSTWGDIKNLGKTINSAGWDSHPALSHTGDTLFFASNRTGGFGMSDIYFSVREREGWSQARNIGPLINTRASEVSPFFHHKDNVLYFGSDGHAINFGRFDIYKARLADGNWMEPRNLGPLVNGRGDDYYFAIDSKSEMMYFARSSEYDPANHDLHAFPVPMEAQPGALAKLYGTLKNLEGKPIRGLVTVFDLDKRTEVAPKYTREDGSFDFDLIDQRNYLLVVQGDEFFRIEEIFFLNGDLEMNEVTQPLDRKIEFKSIEFESGQANILDGMHEDLAKVGQFMLDNPEMMMNISGHTDGQGDAQHNIELSQARADAIKEFLVVKYNLDETRIGTFGFGSRKPLVPEVTEKDRQINRRVEFEIYRN